ncbi:HI1506-related protein [Aggregatibacter actinomycetemcomitans]|uniref:HI1506-related protein n=1 Tax=Aggregatibacter actinomycetemcomitans TaxID=714 RepID=UPI001E5AFDCB|nr:HI1506-related protein [Aggregatibacter actinomycetemcomitans]
MVERFKITVQNRIKSGYCRAGRILPLGESTLSELSAAQVAALQNDPRLVVGQAEPMQEADTDGNPKPVVETQHGAAQQVAQQANEADTPKTVDDGALPADLNNLTVEQLKTKLSERGVQFAANAVKADLVALLADALKTTQDAQ